ncbi:glycosyltransferase, partial [Salmonella enterica subsp. enterica serovar Enteritidis]|nr:glycosyltransferase [Salmonella enterica subsp. enterica serovar Enteritidis]
MRRVVLTTIGTLGDLHPFIAIGLALRKRGFTPVLAVPEDQVLKCRRAGLEAVAILPGFD